MDKADKAELKMEIIRQYLADLGEYRRETVEYRRFLRNLPPKEMWNRGTKMEVAFKKFEYSDVCKRFAKRRDEHRARIVGLGYSGVELNVKQVVKDINANVTRKVYLNNEMKAEAIRLWRQDGVTDEEIAERLADINSAEDVKAFMNKKEKEDKVDGRMVYALSLRQQGVGDERIADELCMNMDEYMEMMGGQAYVKPELKGMYHPPKEEENK